MNNLFTFLPTELIPEKADYFVWYTGTLGQAEWLISFSRKLRGKAIPKRCEGDLSNIPDSILPLLSLEQPDLIVTDNINNPLISIEITEQQAFGTNAQQRIARFWSAVANKIPSAYILPLESYQIEKVTNPQNVRRIIEEEDQNKKEFLLFCETLLRVNGERTYNNGITSIEELKDKIRRGDFRKIAGVTQRTIRQLQIFLRKFVDEGEENTVHLKNIPPEEYYHKVGQFYYKAYLRKPEVTDSMLLEWFNLCSKIIPTYPFKLQSNLKNLFRTNGLVHIINDNENSYLSYRNLPPKPGQTTVVHKFSGNEKDEIELFFNFVDACIDKDYSNDFLRKKIMCSGEYWEEELRSKWYNDLSNIEDMDNYQSGDFSCNTSDFLNLLLSKGVEMPKIYLESLRKFPKLHIYKIYNTEPNRGFYDPYSGNLAVRDILFTREIDINNDLIKFNRIKPLIFLVDLEGESAEKHKFIYRFIDRLFAQTHGQNHRSNISYQDKLIWLLKNLKIHKFVKEIRCHILFSDMIVIRRKHLQEEIEYEIIFGIPTLLRTGIIKETDIAINSMRLNNDN